jgi:hypothetical protein
MQLAANRQRQTGLDIINKGEYTKGGDWLTATTLRLRAECPLLVGKWRV